MASPGVPGDPGADGPISLPSVSDPLPRIDVVVVAYGPEPWLGRCVEAILSSRGVDPHVILVDNGGTEGRASELGELSGVTLVDPGGNVGFAKGCNIGAAAGDAEYVALVNPDALVDPGALAALVAALGDPEVGIATASIRLADDPDRLNSAGNAIHYLGLSWSGAFGELASSHDEPRDVTGASGAGLACRRQVWEVLGGFDDEFFAYHEDADLSLRCWQRAWKVVYVPEAVVVHRYEFSRNGAKFNLVERNRLVMVATTFGRAHLMVAGPLLVMLELAMIAYAAKEGWLREKASGYRWLITHRRWLRERRSRIQHARLRDDAAMAGLFVTAVDPGNMAMPSGTGAMRKALDLYWRAAGKLL